MNRTSPTQQMFIAQQWVQLRQAKYQILDATCLGEGGQSSVWRARREDGETVVLRTVNLFEMGQHNRAMRSEEEVHTLIEYAAEEIEFLQNIGSSAQEHFILPILDHGYVFHPSYPNLHLPTTVMPWCAQGDLEQFTRKKRHAQFQAADLLRWMRQLATALNYIHQQHEEQKIVSVHRDIKPKNILLDNQGNIALTDFGIVRAAVSQGTSSVVASYDLCAPEQLLASHRAKNGHKQYLITPAVDIYALALTLHELVVGGTSAQKALNARTKQQNTVDEHESQLPANGIQPKGGKIGYLGKIGGLTAQEKSDLYQAFITLFGKAGTGQTQVSTPIITLPDAPFMAQELTDFLEKMLAPWPSDRPDTASVKAQFEALESCFTPQIDYLELSTSTPNLILDKPCQLNLEIQGQGLPAKLHWLTLSINNQAAETLPYQPAPSILPNGVRHRIDIPYTLPAEPGLYTLTLRTTVGGKSYQRQTQCTRTLSAQQYWDRGQKQAALQIELRDDWLRQLLRQARTLSERNQLQQRLNELKAAHPASTDQNRLDAALHDVEQNRQPNNTRWGVGLLLLAFLGGGGYAYTHQPADDGQDETNLERNRANVEAAKAHKRWEAKKAREAQERLAEVKAKEEQEQKQLATVKAQEEEKRLAAIEHAKDVLHGDDKTQWQAAAQALENPDLAPLDGEAMRLLGLSYEMGIQDQSKNYAQACPWFKQAAEAGNQKAIIHFQKMRRGHKCETEYSKKKGNAPKKINPYEKKH